MHFGKKWYISAHSLKGICHYLVQTTCSSIIYIKRITECQTKIKHGRFNKFLFSLNAVLHTAQELYTHHYVGADVLPRDSLQQKSYYKHHSNRDAQHYLCADIIYDYSTD